MLDLNDWEDLADRVGANTGNSEANYGPSNTLVDHYKGLVGFEGVGEWSNCYSAELLSTDFMN